MTEKPRPVRTAKAETITVVANIEVLSTKIAETL